MEALPRSRELGRPRATSPFTVLPHEPAGDWKVFRLSGSAAEHHAREADLSVRSVMLLEHIDAALVLGSTQRESDVNREALDHLGLSLVRRRSGGGAVYLDAESAVWIDVLLPCGDALWTDDVSASAVWLGRAWAGALHDLGLDDLVVHEGAMVTTPLSRVICFDGLAPGEVTRAGHKIVGISQRRTREGARFQCVVYREWTPTKWRDCLASEEAQRGLDRVMVHTVGASGDDILGALCRQLP